MRAGQYDEGYPFRILPVPWYPDRSRLAVMVYRPYRRSLNQFGNIAQEFFRTMPGATKSGLAK
jgi:hypothetical protein